MRTRSRLPPILTRGIIRSVWLLKAAPSAGAGAAVQVPTQWVLSAMGPPRELTGSPDYEMTRRRLQGQRRRSVMSENCQDLDCLTGIRVVDFTQFEAGPSCTEALAWLGAEWVKTGTPKTGASARRLVPGKAPDDPWYFHMFNANKKSLAIDLKSPRGVHLVKELLKKADITVENMAPGTIDRLGLGYDEVRKLTPRIIYCSIQGFGAGSKYEKGLAFDMIAQAAGGMISVTGEADRRPALRHRRRPGRTGGGSRRDHHRVDAQAHERRSDDPDQRRRGAGGRGLRHDGAAKRSELREARDHAGDGAPERPVQDADMARARRRQAPAAHAVAAVGPAQRRGAERLARHGRRRRRRIEERRRALAGLTRHAFDPRPLRIGDRHHRQPRDADQRKVLEGGVGLDLGERDTHRKALDLGDVHRDVLRARVVCIGIGAGQRPRGPDHRLLVAGVVVEDAVALVDAAEILLRQRVPDAAPDRLLVLHERVEPVVGRFFLHEPVHGPASRHALFGDHLYTRCTAPPISVLLSLSDRRSLPRKASTPCLHVSNPTARVQSVPHMHRSMPQASKMRASGSQISL